MTSIKNNGHHHHHQKNGAGCARRCRPKRLIKSSGLWAVACFTPAPTSTSQ